MSMGDRFELEAEGRTAVLASTGWQRWASALAGLYLEAGALLDVLGVMPHGLSRIVVGVLLVIAAAVLLVISFASPPLGARVVATRNWVRTFGSCSILLAPSPDDR